MTANTFTDLESYIATPRLSGLTLSADGKRLVTSVATLNATCTGYVSALWEIDVDGAYAPRRLTHGEGSASSPTFSGDGALWFLRRSTQEDAADSTGIWCLGQRGEAREVTRRSGGVSSLHCGRDSSTVFALADMIGTDPQRDEAIRKARREKKVGAILHDRYPVRYWDSDLGPAATALLAVTDTEFTPILADVTAGLRDTTIAIAIDSSFAIASYKVGAPMAGERLIVVHIDLVSDEHTVTTLADDADADCFAPAISPDGTRVAFLRETHSTPEVCPNVECVVVDIAAKNTAVVSNWDRWPTSVAFNASGTSLILTADDQGRGHIFTVTDPLADTTASVTAITHSDHTYSDVVVHPDGSRLFAIRSAISEPAHPVVVDSGSGEVTVLSSPVQALPVPGTVEDVSTTTRDGTTVRGWLVLPESAGVDSPAALLLWIHGGPLSSWNTWSWRWNPWLMVAQGYAVLLPDPALSTGYGRDFIQRGWGQWGKNPYTDLMALTDAVEADERIDETRTAAMGGSFGGYMANWVAGHTDRFAAIVTHASLWALDQFGPTTDAAYYWAREMSPEMAVENSPHLFVSDIVTPMLVIHGDKDYRVPVGEGLRLWYELLAESGVPAADDGSTVHRFLYFPDENHWVLKPQNAILWYQSIAMFLSTHVLGTHVDRPELLGG